MNGLWQDIRFGLRGLYKNPAFAAVTVLSLALGIGATTAMFSLIYAVVLDAYPYADSERTVNPIVRDVERPKDWDWFALTPAQAALYKQVPAFEDILGLGGGSYEMKGQELPEDISVTYLTPNDSTFNRVPALLGRGIQPSDDGQHNVAVLSYKFWIRRFHGDRGIVGRSLQLSKRDFTVVGVMPQRFTAGTPDIFVPSTLNPEKNARLMYFAKLKPGVTPEQASVQVDALVHQFAKENPPFYPKNFHVQLQKLIDPVTKGTGGSPGLAHTFPLIFLATVMLLLIGCTNCSILLLARGTARKHEFAVRSAVGARRSRIIRQLLVECLVIAFAGAMLGIGLSYYLAKLPLQVLPTVFPSEAMVRVNVPVLGFCVLVAVFAGVLFGLLPAIRFSRPEIARTLQASARRNIGGGAGRATLNALIGGQIALTLVLLAVAVAAIGGFVHMLHVPLGYSPKDSMLLGGPMAKGAYPTWQQRSNYLYQLRDTIAATPGVLSAVVGGDVPPLSSWETDVEIIGQPTARKQTTHVVRTSPDLFATLNIPLLRGRVWSNAEDRQALGVAIINQAFAKRYFSQVDPIGREVSLPVLKTIIKEQTSTEFDPPVLSPAMANHSLQIIGIVADSLNEGMDKPVAPALYAPAGIILFPGVNFLVHTRGDPLTHVQDIHRSIYAFNPNQKFWSDTYTLQRLIEEQPAWGMQRLISILFGIFAALALVLAGVGLYSAISYSVSQRVGEFGVRIALGSQRESILWLVLRSVLPTVVIGAATGFVVTLFMRPAFARWSESSSQSPLVLVAALSVLVTIAIAASLIPARRAANVDPMQALRAE